MKRTRILLADDHSEVAEQLSQLLQTEFDVVDIVQDGHALVSSAESLRPDIIISDISMPGLDGISAAKKILRKNPNTRIVFVTIHSDPSLIQKGYSAGALGYVLKISAGEDLIPAVHAALKGNRYNPGNAKK